VTEIVSIGAKEKEDDALIGDGCSFSEAPDGGLRVFMKIGEGVAFVSEAAPDNGHDARPVDHLCAHEGEVDGAEDPNGLEDVQTRGRPLL
jgi:hypothetical protein